MISSPSDLLVDAVCDHAAIEFMDGHRVTHGICFDGADGVWTVRILVNSVVVTEKADQLLEQACRDSLFAFQAWRDANDGANHAV